MFTPEPHMTSFAVLKHIASEVEAIFSQNRWSSPADRSRVSKRIEAYLLRRKTTVEVWAM